MSQNCIEYEQYKKLLEQQPLTPRRNIFEQNRILAQEIERINKQSKLLKNQINHYRNVSFALVDAIGRVFSKELAQQLKGIVSTGCQEEDGDYSKEATSGKSQEMSRTIYQMLITHQEMLTISDWSQSRKSGLRTPDKGDCGSRQIFTNRQQSFKNSNELSPEVPYNSHRSISRSPFCIKQSNKAQNLKSSTIKQQPSTNRSSKGGIIAIATGINCELCQQTFAPNQFIEHASRCKQMKSRQSIQNSYRTEKQQRSQKSEKDLCVSIDDSLNLNTQQLQKAQEMFGSEMLRQINLEDTHDRRLKRQSDSYLTMMKNLIKIQKQIEQQIQMIKCSKQKIDRDAQKRKLEKDLAKVMYVIEQKKRHIKNKENKQKQKEKEKQKQRQKDRVKYHQQSHDKSSKMLKKNSMKLKN